MGIYAVTGNASGIGQAVAKQLKSSGHEVITVDIRDADINADLSDEAQVASAMADIKVHARDGLDGFVPCAGLGPEFTDKKNIPLVNFFSVVDIVTIQPGLRGCPVERRQASDHRHGTGTGWHDPLWRQQTLAGQMDAPSEPGVCA